MSSHYGNTPAYYTVEEDEPESIKVDPKDFNGKTSITKEEMINFFCKKGLSREKVLKEVEKEFEARAPRYNSSGHKCTSAFESRQSDGSRSNYSSGGSYDGPSGSYEDYYPRYSSDSSHSPPRYGEYVQPENTGRSRAYSYRDASSNYAPPPPRSHSPQRYRDYVNSETAGRSWTYSSRRDSSPPPPPPRAPSPPPAASYTHDDFYNRRGHNNSSYDEPISPIHRSRSYYEKPSSRPSRRDPSPRRRAPPYESRGRRPSIDDYGRPDVHVRYVSPGPSFRDHRSRGERIVIEVEEDEPRKSSSRGSSSKDGRSRDYASVYERELEIEYFMAKMDVSRHTAEDYVHRTPREQKASSRRY
ncbi:hypothetical protein HYFRA_00001960 [Hymenoscyphus fraxineus]|uniref:Uncharacterized protein n=1 Tax=Hymenoscyphus fraxineus TaxID=746836 RepID=A0A9N9KNQ9_9HELO|nr:hypothetical protein HYFRA_00001960 [Hymenoscyphus fraxineus]